LRAKPTFISIRRGDFDSFKEIASPNNPCSCFLVLKIHKGLFLYHATMLIRTSHLSHENDDFQARNFPILNPGTMLSLHILIPAQTLYSQPLF